MQSLRTFSRSALAPRAFSTSTARPLARLQLIGRLADTPEKTPTSTGTEVIKYSLGVSTGAKDEAGNRATSWFRVASFADGAVGDLLLSLPKGSKIFVDADARMDTFETKEGEKRTALNLTQRNFEILSTPRPAAEDGAI